MLSVPGCLEPARCPQVRHAPTLPILLALAALAPSGPAGAAAPARSPLTASAEAPRTVQSAEDRGFAIILTSPTEPWLNGRQAIRIDAIIPRDDTVEQVDFFVDRRLVFVDTDEPYTTTFDFGVEIRRHTIEVKALTKEGRRARVSLVSRSVDPAENAQGRVVTLTAVVRDTAGRPVDRLNVSDFTVTEAGARQPIVHFLPGPSPASMALVVDPAAWAECRDALQRFLGTLPGHQAVAVLGPPGLAAPASDARAEPETAAAPAAGPSPAIAPASDAKPAVAAGGKPGPAPAPAPLSAPFTYDVPSLAASLSRDEPPPAEPAPDPESPAVARPARKDPPPPSLADSLGQAAQALAAPRGPRLLVGATASAPMGDEPRGPLVPPPPAEAPQAAHTAEGGRDAAAPPADPLAAALEAARKTGAAVRVIALPAPEGLSWHEARTAAGTLQAAVEASGGSWEVAPDSDALARAFVSVSDRLRHQYVVTYVSGASGPPGWKPLEVTTGNRDAIVEAPRAVYLPE